MTKTCPDCHATVLSTSQTERMGATAEMRDALTEAVRLFEGYGLIAGRTEADPLAAGRWINNARAALSATPAFGGEPVAYRWRQPGNKHWIYDPTPEWIEDHKHEIELEPLYAAPPASPLRGREAIRQILHDHFRTGEPGELDAIEAATNVLASPEETDDGR